MIIRATRVHRFESWDLKLCLISPQGTVFEEKNKNCLKLPFQLIGGRSHLIPSVIHEKEISENNEQSKFQGQIMENNTQKVQNVINDEIKTSEKFCIIPSGDQSILSTNKW